VFFNKGGIEVCFIGLINVDRLTSKTTALYDNVKDFTFYDPIETTKKHVDLLRKRADVFIALTHIGTEDDLRLADAVPELDMIIGGHSHYLTIEPEYHNGVKVLNTDKNGNFIFKTTVLLNEHTITDIRTELIVISDLTNEDPAIVEKIKEYEANPMLSESFATLSHDFNEEQLGLMIVDAALAAVPSAELSVLNCGSIRMNHLHKGPVSYADILRVYPFNNHYGVIALTPAEIRLVVESEFIGPRKSCQAYPGGFHYVMDTANNVTKIVKLTFPDGKELDENKTYRVALNNFLLSRLFSERRQDIKTTPVFVAHSVVQYLQMNKTINYSKAPKRITYLKHKG
jgi:2',3'-cyclic-nucleotide 2'-phosphodiesterase (5'-nucleotidase family)